MKIALVVLLLSTGGCLNHSYNLTIHESDGDVEKLACADNGVEVECKPRGEEVTQ